MEPISIAADPQGHFFVEPIVNGTRLRMMVDTGASFVVLSREDARQIGISPAPGDFTTRVKTANGLVLVAPVVLKEVAIGEVVVRDVAAAVLAGNNLEVGLLGMSFLSKLSHFEVARGRLVLLISRGTTSRAAQGQDCYRLTLRLRHRAPRLRRWRLPSARPARPVRALSRFSAAS
jgi:clan AA aspartic protease (TIGR02281 family)